MISSAEPSVGNIAQIVADMRQVDKFELKLFLGMEPARAVDFILSKATEAKVMKLKGIPVALFGYNITSALFKVASPFMVATNWGVTQKAIAAKGSRAMLDETFEGLFLQNYVLDRNEVAKKWLQWLGFHLGETTEFNGYKIRMFTKDCR